MDDKRLATKRLVEFIEKQSLKRTSVSIAEDIGLDEKTIRNIFRDYINRLEQAVQLETPKLLGIDEIYIIWPRCVICNVHQRTVIDLLPNRNKDTVIRCLYKLPNRQIIRYVCMDMWEPDREAVTAALPQAESSISSTL
jgi:transposase